MLERVEIKGYKSAYDVSLELGRLTVLVGANGSGKTSILEAIAGATAALREPSAPEAATRWFGIGANELEEVLSWQEAGATISLTAWGLEGKLSLDPHSEQWFKVESDGQELSGVWTGRRSWEHDARLLRLAPELIAQPAVSRDERPSLEPSGANAGPVLDSLSRDTLDSLAFELHEVLPDVAGVSAGRKVVLGANVVGHEPVYRIHGHDVRARHASEGTNLVLAILLALASASGPTVVLLDDLQRGLHPKAQADVIMAMRGLLSRKPDLQVLATTHSPYLVDALEQAEVAVVVQRDGRSHVRSLSEHPDADRWKGELRAGEFWSAVGEDWVVGE